MAPRKAPEKAAKNPDAHLLAKYEHHQGMAQKHRAHADLIEAKLKVQGKRIGYDHGHGASSPIDGPTKRKIVKDHVY
jgi:hypothetical protein